MPKSFWYGFGTFISQLISLISLVFVTRYFTERDFGIFSLFSAVFWLIAVLATFQLEHLLVVSKNKKELNQIYVTGMKMGNYIALISSFLVFIFINRIELFNDNKLIPIIISLSLISTVVGITGTQLGRNYLVVKGKFKVIAFSNIGIAFSNFLSLFLFGRADIDYIGLLLAQGISFFTGFIIMLIFDEELLKLTSNLFTISFPINILKDKKKEILQLTLSNFIKTASARIPYLTLGLAGGPAIVGAFGIAFRITSAPSMLIGQALSAGMRYSYSLNVKKKERKEQFNLLRDSYIISLVKSYFISLIIFLIIAYASSTSLKIYLGDQWGSSLSYIIPMLCISEFFALPYYSSEEMSILINTNKYRLIWQTINGSFQIILFFIVKIFSLNNPFTLIIIMIMQRSIFYLIDILAILRFTSKKQYLLNN